MVRTKKFLISMLITAFMTSMLFITLSIDKAHAQDVIRPNNPTDEIVLDVDFSGEKLQVLTTDITGYTYQYWIKEKVTTDLSANLANEQYIWTCIDHDGSNSSLITVTSANIQDGKYHVIVRVKDKTTLIDEIYGSYSAAGISEVKVNGITVEDEVIISRGSTVDVSIVSKSNVESYSLYNGESESTPFTNDSGEFSIPVSSVFKTGYNEVRAEIVTEGGEKDTYYFKVYAYDEYLESEVPVIDSFEGKTPDGTDGTGQTTFTLNVKFADGTPISYEDAGKYNFTLVSGGQTPTANIVETDGGSFKVEFSVDYQSERGIYKTVVTVNRKEITGYDDRLIQYYDGYARSAALTQTAKDKDGDDLALENYTIAKEEPITITADGSITGAENLLQYAFYREDASGWMLIQDYPKDNTSGSTFTWTPKRAGTYNIQARIKEIGAGSYEQTADITYTITDITLTGSLEVEIYDSVTGEKVNVLQAGRPYKLYAKYTGAFDAEQMLYMFTLTSNDLGTVYLNNYTVSPYFMFIPAKKDNYTITARAISLDNFGYKDISNFVNVNAELPCSITWDSSETEYYVDQVAGFYQFENLAAQFSKGTGSINYQVYDANGNTVSSSVVGGKLGFTYNITGSEAFYTIIITDEAGIATPVTAEICFRLEREDDIIADFEYSSDLALFSTNSGTLSIVQDPLDSTNKVLKYVADTQYAEDGKEYTNRIFFDCYNLFAGKKLSYDIRFAVGNTTIPYEWNKYMAVFTRGWDGNNTQYNAHAPTNSTWKNISTTTVVAANHGYFYLYIPYNRRDGAPSAHEVDMTEIAVYIDNIKIIPPEITYDSDALVLTTQTTSGFYSLDDLSAQLSYGTADIEFAVYDSAENAVALTTVEGATGFNYLISSGDQAIYSVVMTDSSGKAAPVTVDVYIVKEEEPRDPNIIADFEIPSDLTKFSTNTGTLSIVEDPLDSNNKVLKYVTTTQQSSSSFTNRIFFDFYNLIIGKNFSYDIRFVVGDTTIPGNWHDYMAVYSRGWNPTTDYNVFGVSDSAWRNVTTPNVVQSNHEYFYVYIPYNRSNNAPNVDMTKITVYIDNVKIIP